MPAVSVIIPCFNQGQYLAEAVASVAAQTFADWEIGVVDDGSTDPATVAVLDRFSHPRATLVRSANRGLAAARNLGIERARGRYILPLDCDDRIAPEYLAEAVALLDADPALGIVYCRAEFFGVQQGEWLLPPFRLPDFIFEPAIFCSAFFRREDWAATGGYNPAMRHGYEDHDFWLCLVERGRKVHQIPRPLFHYRRTPRSMAQVLTLDRQVEAFATMFARHRALFIDHFETLIRGFLRREGLARLHHTRPVLQVFWPDAAGHTEEASTRCEYGAGDWAELRLAVAPAASTVATGVRVDPGMQAGCYEIDELRWAGADGTLGPPLPLAGGAAQVGGTALALPSDTGCALLSFGPDPQVSLAGLAVPPGATHLAVRVRFSPRLEDAAGPLARLAQRPPAR